MKAVLLLSVVIFFLAFWYEPQEPDRDILPHITREAEWDSLVTRISNMEQQIDSLKTALDLVSSQVPRIEWQEDYTGIWKVVGTLSIDKNGTMKPYLRN